LRVTTKPQAAESFEVLNVRISTRQTGFTVAALRWEKLPFPSTSAGRESRRAAQHQARTSQRWRIHLGRLREAAQWCLDNNYNLEEALNGKTLPFKMKTASKIGETKSPSWTRWAERRRLKSSGTALNKASAISLFLCARPATSGNAKRAFELYLRSPSGPRPLISHLALARIDSNTGDFTAAQRNDGKHQRRADATKLSSAAVKRLEQGTISTNINFACQEFLGPRG